MTDWESLMKEAAKRVQKVRENLVRSSKGRDTVGQGAGGDKTLLVDRDAEGEAIQVFAGVEGARIVTEERGEFGPSRPKWTVVIDPIDGSSNFERGIPFYCVSIAVADGMGLRDVKYGIVRNLENGDVYYAEAGGRATKNGKEISTSKMEELKDAVVSIDMCRTTVQNIVKTSLLISLIKRQVHFGANALEVCFLAEGKLDGFVDIRRRMRVTDFAGGYLIAKQAGAIQTSIDGSVLNPSMSLSDRFGVIAGANEVLHAKILEKMAP